MAATDVVTRPVPGEPGRHWRARPFGQTLADLEVDLNAAPPFATTGVLSACLTVTDEPLAETEVWSWTVNRRLQGLLAVTLATRGDTWTLTPRCQAPECAEPMDLPLRLRDFLRDQDPLGVTAQTPDGGTVQLKLPTGDDQRAWLQAGIGLERMVESLLMDMPIGCSPPDASDAIEAALAGADPLTALEIQTVCPECATDNRILLDLEHECLRLLAAEQPRLLDDIHHLALAYHWSEPVILAVPAPRRRQYLARLNEVWP